MNSYVNDNKVCCRMAQLADVADFEHSRFHTEYKTRVEYESDADCPGMAFDVFINTSYPDVINAVFDETNKQLDLLQKEKDKYQKLRNKLKGAYV